MGQRYLIDTNSVIDFIIGKLPPPGRDLIMRVEPLISVITEIELFSSNNISEQELTQLNAFVSAATIYHDVTPYIVQKAIYLRKTYKTKTPDAIIAAMALVYNLTLITHNTKDFAGITELTIIDPWTI